MDANHSQLSFEGVEIHEKLPLLTGEGISVSPDHLITIPSGSLTDLDCGLNPRNSTLVGGVEGEASSPPIRRFTPFPSNSRNSHSHGHDQSDESGTQQRPSPLNSGLWISVELVVTVSQIIASAVVLSLSRDEKPQAPLGAWVVGYAAACLASLPLLCWRYLQQSGSPDPDLLTPPAASPSSPAASPRASYSALSLTLPQDEEASSGPNGLPSTHVNQSSRCCGYLRLGLFMERFKIALDCFFAVWFVVGNVWVFGGHSSSSEAPNLYRLCIVFLTFNCIGYAMPFILCATICCCLPCIITLLGFREDHAQAKGATREVIEALPIYKFKANNDVSGSKAEKDENDSDGESSGEGGCVASGTERERAISPDDAVCCICLGKYKDGAELRELPCTHFFHTACVDEWLTINASCPLCKHEILSLEHSDDGDDTAAMLEGRAGS